MLVLRVNQQYPKILTFALYVEGDFIMRPSTLYAICSSEKGDHILKVARGFALYVSKEQALRSAKAFGYPDRPDVYIQAYKLSDTVKEP